MRSKKEHWCLLNFRFKENRWHASSSACYSNFLVQEDERIYFVACYSFYCAQVKPLPITKHLLERISICKLKYLVFVKNFIHCYFIPVKRYLVCIYIIYVRYHLLKVLSFWFSIFISGWPSICLEQKYYGGAYWV